MNFGCGDFQAYLSEQQLAFDTLFRKLLSQTTLAEAPDGLCEAIYYSLFSGAAKRIRPLICLEAARTSGMPQSKALWLAAALELLHTYSLIHDDLPALDNDDLRRGQPSNHKKFGEDVAILAGDALQALAFECLALAEMPPEGIRLFAAAIGPAGMVGGQYLDTRSAHQLNPSLLKIIHRKKTGRLIEISFVLPFVPYAADLSLYSTYGLALGKLFQIADDLLDATGTAAELGKQAQKDGDKLTYISLYGVEKTRAMIQRIANKLQRYAERHFPTAEFFQKLPLYFAKRRS